MYRDVIHGIPPKILKIILPFSSFIFCFILICYLYKQHTTINDYRAINSSMSPIDTALILSYLLLYINTILVIIPEKYESYKRNPLPQKIFFTIFFIILLTSLLGFIYNKLFALFPFAFIFYPGIFGIFYSLIIVLNPLLNHLDKQEKYKNKTNPYLKTMSLWYNYFSKNKKPKPTISDINKKQYYSTHYNTYKKQ